MGNETRKIPVVRLTGESRNNIEDVVAREFTVTIILNNQEIVTLPCSPEDLDRLAIGYLVSEGIINSKKEIEQITINEGSGKVKIETGYGNTSAAGIENQETIQTATMLSAHEVFDLMDKFIKRSETFKATGGVHSAALCDKEDVQIFKEDIGRNNAIDKLFGECILNDIPVDERIIVVSCRISSEILLKIARRRVPVIISKSPPTDLGVKLANDFGITLLGFVRGKRMNAYSHDWRIADNG